MQNFNKTIVLVGMMGVGKTTIGKKLATRLNADFLDSDHEIESKIGHSVSWIFENIGEKEFRKMEEKTICEILEAQKMQVLALGGGAFLNENIRHACEKLGVSIWLQASAETILKRVESRKDRPLLEGFDDKLLRIKEIIEARKDCYSNADFSIITEGRPHKDIVDEVINIINSRKM